MTQLARELLAGLADGSELAADLPEQLAAAVLGEGPVRLALAVAAGGEHRWARAIDLAALVLRAEPIEVQAEGGRRG